MTGYTMGCAGLLVSMLIFVKVKKLTSVLEKPKQSLEEELKINENNDVAFPEKLDMEKQSELEQENN